MVNMVKGDITCTSLTTAVHLCHVNGAPKQVCITYCLQEVKFIELSTCKSDIK